MQKIQNIDWFIPEILMTIKSGNLIAQEAHLAFSNQKW